ncbi:mercury methylation corrinoid protein HgcA [Desulfocurvibacter africanus]|uniref:mercury methylation corrinoid protein HgcA n=1 Tax=Desulfocurvibacter africanus TaxID=873 RepID=UPI002379E687|nr:mercury methylation corrinoid protein HgcA [Desulfocurvibacter africanus]
MKRPDTLSAADSVPCCGPAPQPVAGEIRESIHSPEMSPIGFAGDRPGYRQERFVLGWHATSLGPVPQVATHLSAADRLGGVGVRWGIGRGRYRVIPGLYAVGSPGAQSPVIVTANYKLTFDALRKELSGLGAWLLVLDTKGVNVWCAAGKKIFSAEEIVRRVRACGLERLVAHRTLVLPQLAAPGVAAREVRRGCGFKAVFGPVCASDLKAFIAADMQASPEMRRVSFGLWDRLAVAPVEIHNARRKALYAALILLVLAGLGPGVWSLGRMLDRWPAAFGSLVLGFFGGAFIMPALLPWLPFRAFALKGGLAGLAMGTLAAALFAGGLGWLDGLAMILAATVVGSWYGLNYTGSSTFTSPSGVERELRRYMPAQAVLTLAALIAWLVSPFAA